jgi:hypothetical protein
MVTPVCILTLERLLMVGMAHLVADQHWDLQSIIEYFMEDFND